MQFTIDRAAFAQSLQYAGKFLNPHHALPTLGAIELTADVSSQRLTIHSTDLITDLTLRLPATIHHAGRLTIPAPPLIEFVRRIPTATVAVEQIAVDQIRLHYGPHQRATLHTLGDEPLPALPAAPGPWLTVPADVFTRLRREIAFSCSTDPTRGPLRGIHWHLEHQQWTAESTDGRRYSRLTLSFPEWPDDVAFDAIVPPKVITETAGLNTNDPIRLALSPTILTLAQAGWTTSTRLLDGTYPHLQGRVSPTYTTHVTLPLGAWRGALERMRTVSDRSQNMETVAMAWTPGTGVTITTHHDKAQGDSMETLDSDVVGEPTTCLFNPALLVDALRAIPSDTVACAIAGPEGGIQLRNPDDPAYEHFALPLRAL